MNSHFPSVYLCIWVRPADAKCSAFVSGVGVGRFTFTLPGASQTPTEAAEKAGAARLRSLSAVWQPNNGENWPIPCVHYGPFRGPLPDCQRRPHARNGYFHNHAAR